MTPPRRFLLGLTASLSTCIAMSACSDDAAPAPTSAGDASLPTSDVPSGGGPCTVLTTAEVAAALQVPMADGVEDVAAVGPYCTWEATQPPSEGLDSPIHLTLFVGSYEGEAQEAVEAMAADTSENVVIEGLGDMAVAHCSFGETDKCDEIYVVVGAQYLQLDVGNYAFPGDYEEAEMIGIVTELAELAVPRLS